MKKPKMKLVCVGWGILMWPKTRRSYLYFLGPSGWNTRKGAIEHYEINGHAYQYDRKQHKAIAKKLWVEVEHD